MGKTAFSRETRDLNAQGFTLVELLVVVVIIVALAAIAVPIFLNQKDKAQDAAAESEIAKVSRYLTQAASVGTVVTTGNIPSTIPGLGSLDARLSTVRADPDNPGWFCIRTTSETGKVLYWETGKGRTTTASDYCVDASDPEPEPDGGGGGTTPNPEPTSTTPTVVSLDTTSGTAELSGTGTFADSANGTTIERTANEVKFNISAANWTSITVTYPAGGGLNQSDTITKSGTATRGVLSRYSPKDVRVALASNVQFSFEVMFSGKSTGIIYVLK